MIRYSLFGTHARIMAIASLSLWWILLPSPAAALETTVNVSNTSELRLEINKANSSDMYDKITIKLAEGTYPLTGTPGEDDKDGGDLDIHPVGIVGTIILEPDANGGPVIFDGSAIDRVFEIFPRSGGNLTVNFNNLTIQNGQTSDYGGGVFIRPGTAPGSVTVKMVSVTIAGNTAMASGGGIAIGPDSSLEFINGEISANATDFNGGGLFCFGCEATLTNTAIIDNIADPPDTGIGGGAVFNAGGTVIVNNGSTISDNLTLPEGIFGGAIANAGYGTLTVEAPIVSTTSYGSGTYNQLGDMTISFPDTNPDMSGDVIILSGSVLFDVIGVLTVLGDFIHTDGDFTLNGFMRFSKAMPWIPFLLFSD